VTQLFADFKALHPSALRFDALYENKKTQAIALVRN